MEFKFVFEDKEYKLDENNLDYFVNDEENPIKDIDEKKIIDILNNAEEVEFTKAFFDLSCQECKSGSSWMGMPRLCVLPSCILRFHTLIFCVHPTVNAS